MVAAVRVLNTSEGYSYTKDRKWDVKVARNWSQHDFITHYINPVMYGRALGPGEKQKLNFNFKTRNFDIKT